MNLLPLFVTLGGILLVSCNTDTPQDETRTRRASPPIEATRPKVAAPGVPASASRPLRAETDTLKLRDGRIARLAPARETEFTQLTGIDTDTTEQKYISQSTGQVQRSTDQLLLTLSNGRQLTLTNNITDPDEPKHVVYRFRGPRANSKFWVLDVTRWESGFVLLVNQQTGRRTRILGRPVLAPDGRQLVTSNSDMEARYSPNGLQIWSLEDGIPLLRWNREVASWGPEEARWLDDKTLIIRQYYPDSTPQIRFARLVLPPQL